MWILDISQRWWNPTGCIYHCEDPTASCFLCRLINSSPRAELSGILAQTLTLTNSHRLGPLWRVALLLQHSCCSVMSASPFACHSVPCQIFPPLQQLTFYLHDDRSLAEKNKRQSYGNEELWSAYIWSLHWCHDAITCPELHQCEHMCPFLRCLHLCASPCKNSPIQFIAVSYNNQEEVQERCFCKTMSQSRHYGML